MIFTTEDVLCNSKEIFYRELNKNTINAVEQDAAFFIKPRPYNPVMCDTWTGYPVTGADYFNLRLSNDVNGMRNTEAELNRTIDRENRDVAHANSYIPYQSHDADINHFDAFIHEQCVNAVNASLARCPFRSNIREHEMDQFKTRLIHEITKNPAFMAATADRAYEEASNYHCLPFDRKNFIEKARDGNSNEFIQLNTAINDHVNGIRLNGRSFNAEFEELSKPLIININNHYQNNPDPKPEVDRDITDFVRKSIRHDKAATVLADVFAGTFIEKAIKLVRTGKRIYAGIVLAGAMFNSQSSNIDEGIAGSIVESRYKIPEKFSENDKVQIGNRIFQGNELKKILNFDNAPFNITGNDTIRNSDYEAAYRAEKTILNMNPAGYNEYRKDMADRQIANYYATAAQKMNAGSAIDFVNVADRIVASQEMKGNNMFKTCRDNPRSFYACLNQTIRGNPQTLEQAVSGLNNKQNSRTQSMSKSQTIQRRM